MTEYADWAPPWDEIKRDAVNAGFRDDGFGDIAPSDWDCIARLVFAVQQRAYAAERRRVMSICEDAAERLRLFGCAHEAAAVEGLIEDIT